MLSVLAQTGLLRLTVGSLHPFSLGTSRFNFMLDERVIFLVGVGEVCRGLVDEIFRLVDLARLVRDLPDLSSQALLQLSLEVVQVVLRHHLFQFRVDGHALLR
ncbi:hypothetical protein N657DRAFT_642270 [Parathielavia appendiculata]|uniref:Uncharacterized protein n=1 Tax=Parathielavia appendiculata TaxID=2587402 RepID=A0AAN6U358_9PEZI|nr:hypothetical protein N657DRAFT_642270 [Parathielavia appendiculata]